MTAWALGGLVACGALVGGAWAAWPSTGCSGHAVQGGTGATCTYGGRRPKIGYVTEAAARPEWLIVGVLVAIVAVAVAIWLGSGSDKPTDEQWAEFVTRVRAHRDANQARSGEVDADFARIAQLYGRSPQSE